MICLRSAQLTTLSSIAQRDFERRAVEYLAQKHPEYAQKSGEAGLRRLLAESQRQASAVQLGSEKGIITWAELSIVFGPGFDSCESWARYITRTLDIDAERRIERLRGYL